MTAWRCTYRLQLGPGLSFDEARALVPYLAELGVSHVYLSPSLQARPGSTHGYDVIDPRAISAELGGREAFDALCAAAHDAGLGVLLDVVPNHMAVSELNPFWADPALRDRFFDIDPATGRHRRFFDIDDLAGVRQEDPGVFAQTHALVLSLVADRLVDGLRIDHPDGLADPAGYLDRLRDGGVADVWVEKILDPGEALPDWPTRGTTGYDFAHDVCALFCDPASEPELTDAWVSLCGDARPFSAWAGEAKLEQATTTFAADIARIGPGVQPADVAALPVYRTYVRDGVVSDADAAVLSAAGLEWLPQRPPEVVTRFQQTTPPVMAKGVEDTAFYRYNRLLALNDVGGDPGRFALDVAGFHAANRARPALALLAGTTHDSKRSADVRARLCALTWMPGEWAAFVAVHRDRWDDGSELMLVLQTVVGGWPIGRDRLDGYLSKALREAKRHSTWAAPDERYEGALCEMAGGIDPTGPFFDAVAALGERIALGQTLLRFTVPGVADLYQGDEDWLFALVDPDNRRPVDFAALAAALQADERPKQRMIRRALALPLGDAPYVPLDAGPGAVAFTRGDVLVCCAVRPGGERGTLRAAAGTWADVLDDGAPVRVLGDPAPLTDVLRDGRALLRRVS